MEGPPLKNDLRREFRDRRRSLTPLERESHNHSINRSVIEMVERVGAKSLSAFLAFDGEPSLQPALNHLSERGLEVAMPVITDTESGKRLQFCVWRPETALRRNAFGIEEPGLECKVEMRDFDLVLIPMVAWDQRGNRLGMGAGYYDRALSALVHSDRPMRIGVAYSIQQADMLPAEPWDVRMHEIITENGRFTCPA